MQTAEVHDQSLTAIAVLPGEILVTGSRDRSIRFWRWQSEQPRELFQLPTSGPVSHLSLAANGDKLAVLIAGERGVHLWDLSALWRRFHEMKLDPDLPEFERPLK